MFIRKSRSRRKQDSFRNLRFRLPVERIVFSSCLLIHSSECYEYRMSNIAFEYRIADIVMRTLSAILINIASENKHKHTQSSLTLNCILCKMIYPHTTYDIYKYLYLHL